MPSYTGGIQTVRNLVDVDPQSDMLRENQEKQKFQEKVREAEKTVDDLSKDKTGSEKINETNDKLLKKEKKIVDNSESGVGSSDSVKEQNQ